jgi:hypothetical protein
MSTLNVATVASTTTLATNLRSNSSTAPPVFQNSSGSELGQLCTAWVYYEMVDPSSIVSSFGIVSLTDQSQGRTRFTFSTTMNNANYCVVSGGFNQGSGDGGWNSVYGGNSTGATSSGQTTTYFDTANYNNGGAFQDQYWAMFAVFGGR